ncbi:MAG: histidine kinase [Elainellaceae cyanobacterium]
MEALPKQIANSQALLQLLLFVDKRPTSSEKIRQIRNYLRDRDDECSVDLQVIDVVEHPYLAEHFRLVATPALIKILPEPRQVLAGSDLVAQIDHWWSRWQRSIETCRDRQAIDPDGADDDRDKHLPISTLRAAEVIRLSDDLFRTKQEREALHEQLQFKDRLIAMLAHDLRNPLTALSIALETLEMGNEENSQHRERLNPAMMAQLLKHARAQTKAIDRMITDILQAAKGTSAGFEIHPKNFDFKKLCLDILNRLKNQYQVKSQYIEIDIPNDLPKVYADQDRVRQLLVNLLDNAIKYTPDGGTIHISALHRTTQKIQVSICDDGPGIPKENQSHIFEDQFRLKRDELKEGYGIGLSLCQRIVRAHYGQIWVDSSAGRGSSFHFTLPVFRQ